MTMFTPRHEGHSATMDMDMEGMDMGSSSSSSSAEGTSMHMMAIFQNHMHTALYSEAWTPGSAGAYAGTIIFLIALAMILRLLMAGKALAEARWLDRELRRRYVVVAGKQTLAESASRESLAAAAHHRKGGGATSATLTENGVEEDVLVVQKNRTPARPWRLSVDPLRALIDTCIAGVGYLL